jgi:hypothetical protein
MPVLFAPPAHLAWAEGDLPKSFLSSLEHWLK